MPFIRQLPPAVVNKIAAGEVIERPASVVKELVENSLDAGATRIDVAVEQGGVELIRVVDDGCGVAADQLPLALASHATSKIVDADDLFRVGTLGFRGEALASIAAVSRLVLRSRPHDAEAAAEIEAVGGAVEQVRPAAGPPGTLIEVRRLFFNTPVRQKFLRSTQTEMGHVSEAVARLALAHPEVRFTLSHGGRILQELPAADLRSRVAALFGEELAAALLSIEAADGELRLSGLAANPSHSRPNNRMQYLFLNGRCIRDRSLQHALGEAYRGLLLTGRYPICFLRLDMPPDAADVNVHPTKLEVRFQDAGRVYSQLLGALRTKFLSTDLVARAAIPRGAESGALGSDAEDDGSPAASAGSDLWEWARRQGGSTSDAWQRDFGGDAEAIRTGAPLTLHRIDPADVGRDRAAAAHEKPWGESSTGAHRVDGPAASLSAPHRPRAIQIHNRYLVTETSDGLEVIDQHALHERILYEALREKVLGGELESQRLLVPEPIDLAAAEAAAALEHRDLLARLGIAIEPFGGETVLLSSYPAMLSNLPPAEVLRNAVEQLMAGGKAPEARDLLDELLHMISCKAAVKFGDRLTPEEVEALLERRELAQDHHHCPHGRPTALVFTREQLDRQFKRI
jgi:DNA mismatch repair protein MutL